MSKIKCVIHCWLNLEYITLLSEHHLDTYGIGNSRSYKRSWKNIWLIFESLRPRTLVDTAQYTGYRMPSRNSLWQPVASAGRHLSLITPKHCTASAFTRSVLPTVFWILTILSIVHCKYCQYGKTIDEQTGYRIRLPMTIILLMWRDEQWQLFDIFLNC